jgi:cytochrome c-type biogenesis protein CcmH/NrfG
VHVSNASLNLEPVVVNLARRFGYEAAVIEQREASEKEGVLPSTWMLLSRSTGLAALPALREAVRPPAPTAFRVPLWTDDFSGLFPVFRWGTSQLAEAKTGTFQARSMSQMATMHRTADALAQLREELRQHPDSPVAMNNLACLLAIAAEPEHRDGAEAVRLAEQACVKTKYENAVILTTLAAAYAESGRFDEAISTGEKACTLAAQNGDQRLLERNRELLEFYRRREPYHQRAP